MEDLDETKINPKSSLTKTKTAFVDEIESAVIDCENHKFLMLSPSILSTLMKN